MPVYTYRREDGTTFEIRQSYQDNPLTQDPETGQKVVRLIQNAGVIFKGSGFYVNDSKSGSKKSTTTSTPKDAKSDSKPSESASTDTTTSAPAEKSAAVESKPAASTTSSADAAR